MAGRRERKPEDRRTVNTDTDPDGHSYDEASEVERLAAELFKRLPNRPYLSPITAIPILVSRRTERPCKRYRLSFPPVVFGQRFA